MTDKANTIGSGTVAGALQYLEFLSSKGHVAPGAITALKSGFSKVMRTLGGEEWEAIEVRSIDIDSDMKRFANMTQGQYNANSLVDYKSRVRKVTTWYLEFLSKPGWTPDIKTRARINSKQSGQSAAQEVEQSKPSKTAESSNSNEVTPQTAKANLVAFPFPLANGSLATLYLPPSITANDANRMARFIGTLVVESEQDNGKS